MLGTALPDGSGIRNYVTATSDRLQRRTTPMIDLYYWTTPNGHKITMFLEETAVPYNIMPVNIGKGEQFKSQFLDVSPNNRIPAIVDRAPAGGGEPIAVFESGAILLYLAEKTGRYLSRDARARIDAIQWLFWQMGNLGPMAGQNNHFSHYAVDKIPLPTWRFIPGSCHTSGKARTSPILRISSAGSKASVRALRSNATTRRR